MVIALVCAGCATPVTRGTSPSATSGEGATPREVAAGSAIAGSAIALDPVWRRAFDTQSALIAHGDVIVESGWSGILVHDAARGEPIEHFAGSDETFRAWIGVDAAHDPVLIDLGAFVLGRDRVSRLARFDPPRAAPRWVSAGCGRLYAAALAGDLVVAQCATAGEPSPAAALVLIDASTGSEQTRFAIPPSGPFDEHTVVFAHGVIAIRAGERVVLVEPGGRVLDDRARPATFGLAASPRGLAIVENGRALVEIDPRTGDELRRIEVSAHGTPHPFTMRLGRLSIHGARAFVEAGGSIHAIDLDAGSTRWIATGVSALLDRDLVHACRGSRYVALDARNGSTVSSYSTGSCDVIGVARDRVLVRYEALPPRHGAEDVIWAGVIALGRREGPPSPCEQATVRGVVRVNGATAPNLTVSAGLAWARESSGVTHSWGAPITPTDEAPLARSRTDSEGRYELAFCDRGHVPVIVDPEQARAFAQEDEAHAFAAYLHLDGRGTYAMDFEVRAHGMTP